jgi:hypothetical protein
MTQLNVHGQPIKQRQQFREYLPNGINFLWSKVPYQDFVELEPNCFVPQEIKDYYDQLAAKNQQSA